MTVYQIIAVASLVLVIALWFRLDTLQATLKQLINAKDTSNSNQPNDSKEGGEPQVQKSEVIIVAQAWMTKNLEVTTFRNGDPIPQASSDEAWKKAGENKQPAYCYNGETFGKLYNWYAVNDPRGLAPEGWHIPTDTEWTQLSDYLGGKDVAGKKMKSTSGWNNKGNGTNESGFNGLPGGYRGSDGTFGGQGDNGDWWSASETSTGHAGSRGLDRSGDFLGRYGYDKGKGFSVRCLRD